jgi:hypothetical protein
MVYSKCSRCKEKGKEIRKTKNPDNKVVQYRGLMAKVNDSKIVALTPRNSLCPNCLEELLTWLTDKDAHVQVSSVQSRAAVRA